MFYHPSRWLLMLDCIRNAVVIFHFSTLIAFSNDVKKKLFKFVASSITHSLFSQPYHFETITHSTDPNFVSKDKPLDFLKGFWEHFQYCVDTRLEKIEGDNNDNRHSLRYEDRKWQCTTTPAWFLCSPYKSKCDQKTNSAIVRSICTFCQCISLDHHCHCCLLSMLTSNLRMHF